MTSAPKQRLQKLSEHLVVPPKDPGTFEDIPKIRSIAPPSTGPQVKDKVIIITGASSPLGIGRATAHQFAAHLPLAIYLCDFNPAHLSTHARELASLHPTVTTHTRVFDAADESAVKAVIGDALSTYQRLDIFFANAGTVGAHQHLTDIDVDTFEKTLHTNVLSVFLAIKHAAPAMQATSPSKPHPSGSIIATASVAGLRSNAGGSDYSASKAAVINLVQTAAYQLAGTGIRVNAVLPGLIETGMTGPVFAAARRRGTEGRIGQLNPLGRGGWRMRSRGWWGFWGGRGGVMLMGRGGSWMGG